MFPDKSIRVSYFIVHLMNRLLNFYALDTFVLLKVVYHCFSCNKDFTNIETAKEHSKFLCHDVAEETQRSGNDDQLFLV